MLRILLKLLMITIQKKCKKPLNKNDERIILEDSLEVIESIQSQITELAETIYVERIKPRHATRQNQSRIISRPKRKLQRRSRDIGMGVIPCTNEPSSKIRSNRCESINRDGSTLDGTSPFDKEFTRRKP